MNATEPESAWLKADEWQGDNGLLGNRRGLEILREAIDQALTNPDAAVVVPVDHGSIRVVKLCDPPPPPSPSTIGERIFLCCLLALFVFILLLGIAGLIALVASLFS